MSKWPTKIVMSDISITPNPVDCKATYKISLLVQEVEVIPYIVSPITGAYKAGQGLIIPAHTEIAGGES